jgi:hypothetical protein
MLKSVLFWGGATGVAVGAGVPLLLPQAPASIQSNTILAPIGLFIINWQNWLVAIGLIAMLIGLFIL